MTKIKMIAYLTISASAIPAFSDDVPFEQDQATVATDAENLDAAAFYMGPMTTGGISVGRSLGGPRTFGGGVGIGGMRGFGPGVGSLPSTPATTYTPTYPPSSDYGRSRPRVWSPYYLGQPNLWKVFKTVLRHPIKTWQNKDPYIWYRRDPFGDDPQPAASPSATPSPSPGPGSGGPQ